MKVDVILDTEPYSIRDPDPDDSWDIGEEGLRIRGARLARLPEDKRYAWDVPGEPGDTAYVLVEHYYDGCTFGSSEYAETKGVFGTREEADRYAASHPAAHGYFGGHIDWIVFDVPLPA